MTLETPRSCRNDENFILNKKLTGSIGVKMKSWIAESDFLFRDARVPRQPPSIRLQASIGENQNASAAGSPSKPEDYHRVNTLFTSLGKVLAKIEDRFR